MSLLSRGPLSFWGFEFSFCVLYSFTQEQGSESPQQSAGRKHWLHLGHQQKEGWVCGQGTKPVSSLSAVTVAAVSLEEVLVSVGRSSPCCVPISTTSLALGARDGNGRTRTSSEYFLCFLHLPCSVMKGSRCQFAYVPSISYHDHDLYPWIQILLV